MTQIKLPHSASYMRAIKPEYGFAWGSLVFRGYCSLAILKFSFLSRFGGFAQAQ